MELSSSIFVLMPTLITIPRVLRESPIVFCVFIRKRVVIVRDWFGSLGWIGLVSLRY